MINPKATDESLERSAKWATDAGQEIPEGYHVIRLNSLQIEIYTAFNRLSMQRDDTGYKKPIKDADILRHIDIHGSCGLYGDDFMNLIYELDNKYLTLIADKLNAEAERMKNKVKK